ncbi:MAG: divalent-cation tolerance protein CutA [Nitrosopumilaceae archaeon]
MIKSSSKVIATFFNHVNLSVTVNMVIIVSTYPNKKSVNKIANQLVKTKLAACVNISKISSVYTWKGKVENTSEYLALFKTIQKNKKKLKEKIKSTHPYDVPEIAEINVNSINKPYLKWLVDSTL